jgi:hypothetical protein
VRRPAPHLRVGRVRQQPGDPEDARQRRQGGRRGTEDAVWCRRSRVGLGGCRGR